MVAPPADDAADLVRVDSIPQVRVSVLDSSARLER